MASAVGRGSATNRLNWRIVTFEGVIDIRRNLITTCAGGTTTVVTIGATTGAMMTGALTMEDNRACCVPGSNEIQLVATNRFLSVGNDRRTVVQISARRTVFAVGHRRRWQWVFLHSLGGHGEVMTIQGRGEAGIPSYLPGKNRADTGQFWLIKPGRTMGITSRLSATRRFDSPSSARSDGGRMQIYTAMAKRISDSVCGDQRFGRRLQPRPDRDSGRSGGLDLARAGG